MAYTVFPDSMLGTTSAVDSGTGVTPPTLTLPDTAEILRNVGVDNGLGGKTTDWQVIATVPYRRIKPIAPDMERVEAGEMRSILGWECAFEIGTDLRPADRVRANGELLEVRTTNVNLTSAPRLLAHLVLIRRND